MSDWSNLFESFYTGFVIRDVVAKVTPGLVLAMGIATLFVTPSALFIWFRDLPSPLWFLVVASAWLLGLAIQSFAELHIWWIRVDSSSTLERVGLLWYWPLGLSGSDWSKVLVASRYLFASGNYSDHAARFERFEAIKEACGISYVAILLLLVIRAMAFGITTKCLWCQPPLPVEYLLFFFTLGFLILLRRMHIMNVWRQYLYARDLLEKDLEVQKKVEGLKEVLAKKIAEPKTSLCIFGIVTLLIMVLSYIVGVLAIGVV